ncbi:NAD(P)/FAD-dependent oxidoreductase [Sphingomonas psychrotolerans]|uniref:NAD(P)/FAD-dependent oxidoreductase n=1 Tax=Sphingomonas psychrotolerans TaxID=1327635 RepID=A0ABU3NAW6_9SPHN|nr:FAD-dependent oxidoreductase [Sphingomonas psychrotolerans]MDT8760621.1 NAD(P)/FAD-dependent oxidoreductase [Sphingomonas psychrotolerans]
MRGSSTVWRALAAARARNAIAAGEAAPVPAPPGATRRALIKGIAAAGLAPMLPRPAYAFAGGRVAIIGGGIAGLSALHHLREAGVDAQLYEGRTRTGGRMYTHRPTSGPWFEVGGQLVNTDHDDMQKLCARFGVTLVDRKAEPHRTLILGDGRLLGEAELAEALRPIAAQIDRDSARLDKDFDRVAAEIDHMSIAGYLDKHAGLIEKSWIRELLEATSRTEYGVEPAHASAVELVFNLPTVDGARIEVLGESDERYVMQGGSSSLIEAMTAHYADRITTGKRLARIESAHGGMRMGFLDGSSAEAETVIVAVPAPLLRQIEWRLPLPAIWREFIAEVALGHNEKVQAAMGGTPWKAPMGVGGELWQTSAEAGWALGWDGSVHRADGVAPVWTWFLGGEEVTRAADEAPSLSSARYAGTAAPAIPGLAASATGPFGRTNWHAQALTLGAYVNYRPGQITRFARLLCVDSDDPAERRVPSAGRVFFAGEHLSEAYPGYMNGGAETGRVAAQAISGTRKALKAA